MHFTKKLGFSSWVDLEYHHFIRAMGYMSELKEESRFDGKFVLTTNTEFSSEEVAVTYKNLLQVEYAFQAVKLAIDGKEFLVRSDFEGVAHRCFMAAGVKPPPQIRKM